MTRREAKRRRGLVWMGLQGIPSVLIAGLFILLGVSAARAAERQEGGLPPGAITVAMDDNYPPYVFRDEDGQLRGILVDHWRAWEKSTGVRVKLAAMDWAEAQRFMLEGKADVIDTIFKTPERESILTFGKPYADIELSVLVHNSLAGIADISSLKGFTVGVKRGGAVTAWLRQQGVDSLREFASDKEIVEAAVKREIWVMCLDVRTATHFLAKLDSPSMFQQAFVARTGQFHRAVRKGDDALLGMVEEGFAAIPVNTRLVIERRWSGTPLLDSDTLRTLLQVLAGTSGLVLVLAVFLLTLRRKVRARTADLERTAQELRQGEEYFRTLFNAAHDIILVVSWPQGTILDANQQACRTFGYTRAGMERLTVADLSAGEAPYDQGSAQDLLRRAAEGSLQVRDWAFKTRDGRFVWMEVTLRRVVLFGEERLLLTARDLSEHKQTEAALKYAEAFSYKVLQSAPDGVLLLDGRKRISFINDKGLELLGYSEMEVALDRGFENHWTGDELERYHAALNDCETGRQGRFIAGMSANADPIFLDIIMTQLDADSFDQRYLVTARDVTEHVRASAALEQKEALLQAMIHTLPFDFWARDAEQRIIMQSEASIRLWGDLSDDPEALHRAEQEYGDQWRRTNARALAGELVLGDTEYALPTGEARCFRSIVGPITSAGQILGIMGANIDQTDRIMTEKELSEHRLLLACILNTLPHSVFWKDAQGRYQGGNTAFLRDVGLGAPEELIGKTDSELPWKPGQALRCPRGQGPDATPAPCLNCVEQITLPDARCIWVRMNKVPMLVEGGVFAGTVGIYEDITTDVEKAAFLEAIQERGRALFAASPVGIVRFDSGGRILEVNPAFIELCGGTTGDWLGREITAIGEAPDLLSAIARSLLDAGTATVGVRLPGSQDQKTLLILKMLSDQDGLREGVGFLVPQGGQHGCRSCSG